VIHGDLKPDNVLIFKTEEDKLIAKVIDFGFSCFGATDEDLVELPFTEKWSAPEWDGGEFPIWQAKKADIYTFTLVCKWILGCKSDDDSNLSDDSGEPCASKYLQGMFKLGLNRDPTRRPGNIRDLLVFLDKASNNRYHK
jgi:serine/threonine protein kinase